MRKTPLNPAGLPAPIAPYSTGTLADGVVYVAGILAMGEGGAVLYPDDAAAQTRHVLEVIRRTLAEAGATMGDITFNHIFLTDWANYAAINSVYAEYFPKYPPARYCVQVGLVRPGLLVEIASIAHVGAK